MSEYQDYLKSDEWKEKRKLFIELAGNQCERCGNTKKLQVHHKNYDNIYNEEQDDVEVLCLGCHKDAELEKGKSWIQDKEYGEW